jgi:hypothetical protein
MSSLGPRSKLARAVAAVVVEDDGVAVADGSGGFGRGGDDAGGDELIAGHVGFGGVVVVVLDGLDGGGEAWGVGEDEGAVGLFDARPAVVAVHGVVAAADGGDATDAELLHSGFDLADVVDAVGGG